jgi:hypothetical protein
MYIYTPTRFTYVLTHSQHRDGSVLYRVHAGFAGQGQMHVLGASGATGMWVADLARGNVIVNVELPRVAVGGLTLTRDGGSVGGPLYKMIASVLDRKVYAYIQGSLSVGSMSSFVLLRVTDEGLSGATAGRYGAGLHVSVTISAGKSSWLGTLSLSHTHTLRCWVARLCHDPRRFSHIYIDIYVYNITSYHTTILPPLPFARADATAGYELLYWLRR